MSLEGEGVCQLISQPRYKKVLPHGSNLLNVRLLALWVMHHIFRILQVNCWEEGEGCERDAALRLTAGVRGHIGTVKLLQLHSHTSPFENVTFLEFGKNLSVESQKQRRYLGAKGGGNSQYVIGSVWWLPFFQTIFWFKMQQWEIEQLRIFFCELNNLDISYHISQQHLFPWKMSETALMHESFNSWWNYLCWINIPASVGQNSVKDHCDEFKYMCVIRIYRTVRNKCCCIRQYLLQAAWRPKQTPFSQSLNS